MFVKSNHMCVQKTNCSTPVAIEQQTSTHGVDFILGLIVFRVTLIDERDLDTRSHNMVITNHDVVNVFWTLQLHLTNF